MTNPLSSIASLRTIIPAVLGLVLAALSSGCGGADGGVVQLRLSHSHSASESSEIHTAALAFKEHLEANSDLQVRIFPNNQLGQERDVYEAMQLGAGADMAITGTAVLNNFSPRIGVLDLPFLWTGYDHVHRVLDGDVGGALASDLRGAGLRPLAWMDSWGHRNVVTANRRIESPDDLRGLKIRTIQTPTYIAALDAMGASPTPMAFGEVYTAMQTGVVDGFEHSASAVYSNKLHEVGRHMAMTRHLFGPLVFCVSERTWNRLTPEQQAAVEAAAIHARDHQRALAEPKEAEAIAALEAAGMEITEIDTAVFRERARAVQDQLAERMGASDLLAAIRAAE